MKKLVFLMLLYSTIIYSQEQIKNSEKDIIGRWQWLKITSFNEKGEKIIQTEYAPGSEAVNIKEFNKDHTFEEVVVSPENEKQAEGTWQIKNDTLIFTMGSRIVTTIFSINKNQLSLKFLLVTDTDYINDYRNKKYSPIEEYVKIIK